MEASHSTRNHELERFESDYASIWFDDGILCTKFSEGIELTFQVVKACVDARIFLSRGQAYPVLLDIRGLKSATGSARKYLASMGSTLVTADALVIGSPATKTIGNIFIKVDSPPVPTKLFVSEQKAKEWLTQYRSSAY